MRSVVRCGAGINAQHALEPLGVLLQQLQQPLPCVRRKLLHPSAAAAAAAASCATCTQGREAGLKLFISAGCAPFARAAQQCIDERGRVDGGVERGE